MEYIYHTKKEEDEMIASLRIQFPECVGKNFEFHGNELYSSTMHRDLDMNKLCNWLYSKYRISQITVEVRSYKTVFARSKTEAKNIVKSENESFKLSTIGSAFISKDYKEA